MRDRRLVWLVSLAVWASVGACKKTSALEDATAELPESELVHERVEARPGASRRAVNKAKRAQKRAQLEAARKNAKEQGETLPEMPPEVVPEVGEQPPEPWQGSMVQFDGSNILFDGRLDFSGDQLEVLAASRPALDELARLLTERPGITKVEVQAHLDGRAKGDRQKVTQMRAETVRTYLVTQGVEAERIVAKGYGSDVPIDTNRTPEGRRNNQRVEVTVQEIVGSESEP